MAMCLPLIFLIFCVNVTCTCPPNTVQGLTPHVCYEFVSEPTSWFYAYKHCNQHGNHLASVPDAFINAYLLAEYSIFVNYNNNSEYWLGGTSIIVQNQWAWSDGSDFAYTNWAPGR